MRTTVRLPPGLMAQVKKLARETGRSMTQVIEDALRVAVARGRTAAPRTVSISTTRRRCSIGWTASRDVARRQRAGLRAPRGLAAPRGVSRLAAAHAEGG